MALRHNDDRIIMRSMTSQDVPRYSRMLKSSFNRWYWQHGWGQDYFRCADEQLDVFYTIYNQISPGCNVAVFNEENGEMMGACFYHPRSHHVSLGIMSVNPDYFGQGVGKMLVGHVIDYTENQRYDALRLVGSAINMDSFSLYNRSGFVPRQSYHDMVLNVPADGMRYTTSLDTRVRDATLEDVRSIAALELEISGIHRDVDYRFCIENQIGCMHASVVENDRGKIVGFAASIMHPAINMIGPAFARSEEQMLALLLKEMDRFRGKMALFVIPMDRRLLVETLYRWGARNVETHLFQVRGRFQPFAGVNLPSFLPETG